MSNDGEIRDGIHDEMDRGIETQYCTTSCNSMSERNGKDERESSRKQTCSCCLLCHSLIVAHTHIIDLRRVPTAKVTQHVLCSLFDILEYE